MNGKTVGEQNTSFLLVESFTSLPFLPQLVLCWCALCCALSLIKS